VLHRLLASDPGSEGVPVRLRPGEGIAGSVWADGEAFVYHDAATDRRLSQVGAVDLPQTAGSGVCVPLGAGKESLGTLHVHRPTPWGLSPRERAFVADVGRWAAQALRTADDEDHERRSRLVERAFELIQRYLAATGGEVNSAPEEEAELLAEIGEALVAGLGGGPAWLLVADPTRSQFRCRRAWGVAVEVVPEPAPAAVETRLGGARFRICDPTTKTVLSPLLDGFKGDSEVRRLLDTSPWVVLRFAPGGELLALFFLAVPPPHCVNRARTERWARTLDLLSAVFVLGRRLVHAHQELPNDATE